MNSAVKCLECGSFAILFHAPSRYAGIWECQNPDCMASETHEHCDYKTETKLNNYLSDGDSIEYETEVYVCGVCGVDISLDEADPAEDKISEGLVN